MNFLAFKCFWKQIVLLENKIKLNHYVNNEKNPDCNSEISSNLPIAIN